MLSDTGTGIAGNAPVATAVTVPVRTPIDTGAGTAGATPVALATMRGVVICIGPVAAATGAEPAGVLELLLGLLLGPELGPGPELGTELALALALRLGAGRFGIATVGTLFGTAGPGVKETWGNGVDTPAVFGAFLPGASFVAAWGSDNRNGNGAAGCTCGGAMGRGAVMVGMGTPGLQRLSS